MLQQNTFIGIIQASQKSHVLRIMCSQVDVWSLGSRSLVLVVMGMASASCAGESNSKQAQIIPGPVPSSAPEAADDCGTLEKKKVKRAPVLDPAALGPFYDPFWDSDLNPYERAAALEDSNHPVWKRMARRTIFMHECDQNIEEIQGAIQEADSVMARLENGQKNMMGSTGPGPCTDAGPDAAVGPVLKRKLADSEVQ